jgi:catechol 2,3-dioxygenase-like lactoylglutathione lyase family enzyme
MRGSFLFLAGMFIGSAMQGVSAQPRRDLVMLNHVAIAVPDLDEGIRFYSKALGAKEAFTFRDNRGRSLPYLQLSRETFLELQPAGAGRQPGVLHVGLEMTDLRRQLPQFTAAGFTVTDPIESPRTKALISQAAAPNGVRFELLEFGPESLQRKMIDNWK